MALEIVWRNPTPPAKAETRVESIAVDELGSSICHFRTADETASLRTDSGWRGLNIVVRDLGKKPRLNRRAGARET
jgi:hypothetical protein